MKITLNYNSVSFVDKVCCTSNLLILFVAIRL